jgi:hypothetical protein
MCTALMDPP